MKRAHVLVLAGSGLLSLAACGPTMHSDRDLSVPVPQGATWAWVTDTGSAAASAPVGEIVAQRFRRAIAAAMEGKGYREAGDTAGAEFLLSLRFADPMRDHPPVRRGGAAVAVGFSSGWGYPAFGRFGFYRPWGFYSPWAFYQPWGFYGFPAWGGYYAAPYYVPAYRVYSDRALTVVLRHKATGYVAWSGRLGSDALAGHQLTQDRVRKIVDKLFDPLH